jgi:hypothetical protein
MRLFGRRRSDRTGEHAGLTPGGHPKKISIVSRWDFEVRDPNEVIAAVIARLIEKGYEPDDAADHVRDVEQALLMLHELDGWEPVYEAIGLEFAGSSASSRAVEKTIEDGDDDF